MFVNKFLNFENGWDLPMYLLDVACLNMYAKGSSKKIWHEMIILVCSSKNYTILKKYNIVSISFKFDFGHISIPM
jgi:hypothetical protein